MIYAALCKHLGVIPAWNPVQSLPPPIVPSIHIEPDRKSDEEILGEVVGKMYDLEADYDRMKKLLNAPPEERPMLFDELRTNYPVRREFYTTNVTLPKDKKRLTHMFEGIGF
jgi:erythronate-4-phosphate dehydrogenase